MEQTHIVNVKIAGINVRSNTQCISHRPSAIKISVIKRNVTPMMPSSRNYRDWLLTNSLLGSLLYQATPWLPPSLLVSCPLSLCKGLINISLSPLFLSRSQGFFLCAFLFHPESIKYSTNDGLYAKQTFQLIIVMV